MSDEESPSYKDGDTVWVKLGPCWWPGEVSESGPEDFAPKKPPLVIVKFFNEDTYEFVKSYSSIYLYNCDRKNEFIRKGMDSFRGNNPHMSKFPGDVSLAEIRTGGNPNILSDPMFLPQKKTNIFSELFGTTPKPKKTKEAPRHSQGHSKKGSGKKGKVNVTHRRFLGCDDYEAHIRVQYPGKDTGHHSSDEEIVRLNTEPSKKFNCSSCAFETSRLEVMLFHVQCHIKGVVSPMPTKKKGSAKRKKKRIFKHITSDDDINNSSATYPDTDSDEEVKPKPKRKKRTPGSPRKPKLKKQVEEKPTVAEIRTNLLAEWNDSDEQEDEEMDSTLNSTVDSVAKSEDKEEEKSEEQPKPDLSKSCFDFDEEEDEEDALVQATTAGRKIPRVIPPPSEKRKSEDAEEAVSATPNLTESSNDADVGKEEDEFKDLMEATSVPDVPDVAEAAKTAPNFPEPKTSEVATKLTNPKKRFVKSFEDFELLQNEQRRAQEELEKEKANADAVVVEAVEQVDLADVPKATADETIVALFAEKDTKKTEETETKPNDTFKELDNLQISKLKCQIMSKLGDEDSEPVRKGKSSHRSPRSKILESYKKSTDGKNESKGRKSVEEKSEVKTRKHTEDKREPEVVESKQEKSEPKAQTSSDEKSEVVEDAKKEVASPDKSKPGKEEVVDKNEEDALKSEVIKEIEAIPEKNPDEEIGKITQIDEYLNDFLFDIPKKAADAPKESEDEEMSKNEESNEVHIKCASNDDNVESELDIAIKTNLTNFNKNEEEMSALSTLAMVSQLETNLEKQSEEEKPVEEEPAPAEEEPAPVEEEPAPAEEEPSAVEEEPTAVEEEPTPVEEELQPVEEEPTPMEEEVTIEEEPAGSEEAIKPPFDLDKPEPELVPIDGNLTVVSEKDLADSQVEITAQTSPTCKKPVTLTSFSMDFSECNSSNSDSTPSEPMPREASAQDTDASLDLEDHIPSQIVDKAKPAVTEPTPQPASKLLERLTTPETKSKDNSVVKSGVKVPAPTTKTKFVIKSASKMIKAPTTTKPIILSEKIIKPLKPKSEVGAVSVQKITSKRNLHDPDEIDAFIIQKGAKSVEEESEASAKEEEIPVKRFKKSTTGVDAKKMQATAPAKKRGKAKILQQTIITPTGEIIQPGASATVTDDNVFDINSMPIVLSDQILTPESIENMPIYLEGNAEQVAAVTTPKIQKKTIPVTVASGQMRVLNKSIASSAGKLVKTPKILGSIGSKLIKHNSLPGSKQGKYVIVTQAASGTTPTSKYTVGKKQAVIKRGGELGTLSKVQNLTPEPSGNKIMILTNQQGQQQRVLLTPAQQKMMGYQNQGTKVTKTLVKGNIIQKTKDGQLTAIAGSSGLISKTITPSRITSTQTLISSSGQVLTPIHQTKTVRLEKTIPQVGRKIQVQNQKLQIKPTQKTILIKNQHGHTVRKIQGTDDALLDKQVAEQIEAIKASGVLQQKQEILNYKSTPQPTPSKTFRRSYMKKVETPIAKPKVQPTTKSETAVPPLAPISPKKPEAEAKQPERALHQLVIQDAMGNQTTITEGQILALPSETIDGQPQSYMLVTLDESGNLTPLNNEALLSLDPNLGLGGDLGNLQIDQSALKQDASTPEQTDVEVPKTASETPAKDEEKVPQEVEAAAQEQLTESVLSGVGGESGQQLIVTGDPIAAQKFLESLTEGNTDLANILASAEGSSILIHADGQQILINTDADNQMLLSVNTDSLNASESTEGGGNPIFATQPAKNQDILAAALADTDVFQQEQNGVQNKVSQLSPSSALYPMNVGNVLETSLTLNSPIMTPLEVPSTNSKKIVDESDILGQVPKNVDLPITITDPNISQTVSHQQVASLMVNELQSNLELSLPITDSTITATSSEMNSPSSFVYSLPSLDGSIDMNQKPFSSSMPLLTEDAEDVSVESEPKVKLAEDKSEASKLGSEGAFLDESEGLCTLGSEMCSSLSEPPPDMFDLSAVLSSHQIKSASPKNEMELEDKLGEESASSESANPDTASVTETSSPNTTNEDSCEIPVQPEIVATLNEEKRATDGEAEVETKKCKFD